MQALLSNFSSISLLLSTRFANQLSNLPPAAQSKSRICRVILRDVQMDTTRAHSQKWQISEFLKGECSKVRSSISPTKLVAKISRSLISSISVPSPFQSFFWSSFLYHSPMEISWNSHWNFWSNGKRPLCVVRWIWTRVPYKSSWE